MKADSIIVGCGLLKKASLALFVLTVFLTQLGTAFASELSPITHALSMHGAPALEKDFSHFPYANPNAPKGGKLVLGAQGTFDTLNPFIIRGIAAQGISGFVIESLMARSLDEPFTLYPLIAQRIEVAQDRSHITFYLDPRAAFSDGSPLTAQDVRFSFETLKTKGRPNHRNYYSKVEKLVVVDAHTLKFSFKAPYDRELPMIIGLMPILSQKHTSFETFDESNMKIPIGSGPYKVGEVQQGKFIALKKNPTYWGEHVASNRGRFNFETLRFEYFRDQNTLFEAFKVGDYDVRTESDPIRWQTQYNFSRVQNGDAKNHTFGNGLPKPISALAFNMRRKPFDKIEVRRALIELFDAQWVNTKLYGNALQRTSGFFDGSELSSIGVAPNAQELDLLKLAGEPIDPQILAGKYKAPISDGSGRDRERIRVAFEWLKKGGYEHMNGRVVHTKTNTPLSFEILVNKKDDERLALVFSNMLSRVGIEAKVRLVDSVQYENRRQKFDFDMMPVYLPSSASPGQEQTFRWGSISANREGSFNFSGVKSDLIDTLIVSMLQSVSKEDYISHVRALDRALLSQAPHIPLFHLPGSWVSVSTRLGIPQKTPLFGYVIDAWWDKSAGQAKP